MILWRSGLLQTFISNFGHDKDFIWQSRGFSSIQEHDEVIIQRWNEVIVPNDQVYILGDLMLGDNEHGMECIKKLNGSKFIILGNHDTRARQVLYNKIDTIDILGYADLVKIGKYHFYLSHYPTLVSNLDEDKPLYARLICLCGHYHADNPLVDLEKGNLIYHVELDAHNCYPVNVDTIIADIRNKIFYTKENEGT